MGNGIFAEVERNASARAMRASSPSHGMANIHFRPPEEERLCTIRHIGGGYPAPLVAGREFDRFESHAALPTGSCIELSSGSSFRMKDFNRSAKQRRATADFEAVVGNSALRASGG
jgi:hypothetical protein